MNGTQLQTELEQCLSWGHYADEYGNFEQFNKEIAPLDSEWFSVSQIEALYQYCIDNQITLEKFYAKQDCDGFAIMWLDYDQLIGTGSDLVSATQHLLNQLVAYSQFLYFK